MSKHWKDGDLLIAIVGKRDTNHDLDVGRIYTFLDKDGYRAGPNSTWVYLKETQKQSYHPDRFIHVNSDKSITPRMLKYIRLVYEI